MLEGGSGSKETKSNADNPENKSSESEKTQKGLGKIADKLSALFSDDIKDGQKESDLSEKSETKEAKDTADFENGENKKPSIKELFDNIFSDDFLDKISERNNTENSDNKSEQDDKEDDGSEKSEGENKSDSPDEGDNVSEDNDAREDKELTEDEINEKQKAAIKEALERIRNGEKLTNEELGNLGEMMMDQYYISKGYKPLNKHRVTSLDDKKGGFKTGIDGVYEKTNPDGTKSYVIADAKYNTSQLSETNDGKQMSDNWIDKRLDDAVGKEKADEIRDAAEDDPDSVTHEVYHIDPNIDENGNMHTDTQKVDSEGNKVGDKTIVEYFDEDGNRIEPSDEN